MKYKINILTTTFLLSVIFPLPGCLINANNDNLNNELIKDTASVIEARKVNDVTASNALEKPVKEPMVKATPVLPVSFWEDLSNQFQLDLTYDHPKITAQRNWYISHPKYINRVVKRAERYIYYIFQQAQFRGIPAELVLLPIVESAFDPFAYSHGRASGMWQFIPGTAKAFGLKQTWWYDGRRDVKASTNAAFDYLTKLSKQFDGDWLLALAAYNSGGGTVRKAIRKNKKKGLATDFWSLKLPKETSAYVPKLIAIAQIFQSPSSYGLTLPEIPNRPLLAIANTDSQIDMAQAATLTGISLDELYLLNPGFNRWATDPQGPHSLLLPIDKAESFALGLAQLPEDQRVSWTRYKIKSGDSLISIAKKNRTTAKLIREVNHINGNRIVAGKTLLIPSAAKSSAAYRLALDQRIKSRVNRPVAGKRKIHHYVQTGDSFWKISKRYKVNTRQLAKWNGMAPTDPLMAGKKLTLWVPGKGSLASGNGKIRKVNYNARNGDSYARIADKFNVSVAQLQRWNKIDLSRYLQPGDRLTLYVDITMAP